MFKIIAVAICLLSISSQATESQMIQKEESAYTNELKNEYKNKQLVELQGVEYVDAYLSTMTVLDLSDQINGEAIDRLSRGDIQVMKFCIQNVHCELYEIFVATVGFVQDTGTLFW